MKVFSTDDCCGDKDAVQDSLGSAAAPFPPAPLVESENYHKRLKDVVFSCRVTPRLAHSVLVAFNADWNVGLPRANCTFSIAV